MCCMYMYMYIYIYIYIYTHIHIVQTQQHINKATCKESAAYTGAPGPRLHVLREDALAGLRGDGVPPATAGAKSKLAYLS